jgi:hypothetical protein
MKPRWVLPAAIVVSIIVIAALIPSMQNPEIYKKTPEEYTTPFHTDPGLYQKSDLNSSESSLFLMQDMLDITGPLTLNIRISDPESAVEGLSRYRNLLGSMDKLIVKIEMNQSYLEDYLSAHKDNEKILSELLNETQDLSRLKELELQFTDQENPGSYVSVIYHESAIRDRISQLYNRYHGNREVVNTSASKYGLNMTEYESSIENFASIVERETNNQDILDKRVADIKKSIANQTKYTLTIEIFPKEAIYGDTVTIRGLLYSNKMRGQNVTMIIDNRVTAETRTTFAGEYEFQYPINKITSGRHIVYTSTGGLFSDPGSFTIIPVNSVTSLVVPATSDRSSVNITGSLYTSTGIPVRDAPVTIILDRTSNAEVITGMFGQYYTLKSLPNGNHTLQAIFQGSGYPVNPSKSPVFRINVQSLEPEQRKTYPLLFITVLGGAVVISTGIVVLYLWRRRVLAIIRPSIPHTTPEDENSQGLRQQMPVPKDSVIEGDEILTKSIESKCEQKIQNPGYRESAYDVYWEIISLIHDRVQRSTERSLTTREILYSCRGKPYYPFLRSFIMIYERVRYGPEPLKEEDMARLEKELRNLIAKIRGN